MEYFIYMTNDCNLHCQYCSVLLDCKKANLPITPTYSSVALASFIEKVQKESGFTKEYVDKNGENASTSILNSMFGTTFGRDIVWTSQCKVISRLAEEGPCVIVGRCADYVLREKAELLKVFIHASYEKRAERIVTLYGESDTAIEKRIKEKDKRRSAYYKYYTEIEYGDARNYDVALDSGKLGIEKCVEIITDLYKN